MKILISSDWNDKAVNGVVTSILNLREGLEKMGHEVKILALSDTVLSHTSPGVYYAASMWMGYVYPKARGRIITNVYPDFIKELIEWKPDIVHTNCELSTFPLAEHVAHKAHAPIVHTYHTVYEYYVKYIMPFPTFGKMIVTKKTKDLAQRTDHIIVPTKKMEEVLRSYGLNTNISVIPSGIKLEKFKKRSYSADPKEIRKELGIPDNHRVLIHVGRVAKEKNIEELIGFMRKLKGKNFTLVIVGGGPQVLHLSLKVQRLGLEKQVLFTGMIDPKIVPSYYRVGDLFVCASKTETQGLCYVEALCCGVPLLCRADPCLDGYLNEGENGWEYRTEEEFFNKLSIFVKMDKEERERVSVNAEKSVEKLSVSVFAETIEKLYKDIISSKKTENKSI